MNPRRGTQPHHLPVPVCKPKYLPVLYNASFSITKEKKANLLDVCRYVPNEYHGLYRSLPTEE
jgi:hypothetical protein